MKKLLSILLALAMCMTFGVLLTACSHEHEWDKEWKNDEISHWHACTGEGCTEISDKAEHQWNAGEITTKPTATADGVKTFKCTVCAKEKTEVVKPRTDVTAAEWESALKLNEENFSMTSEITIETADEEGTPLTYTIASVAKKNGDIIQETMTTSAIPGLVESESTEVMYYAKEGDKYYMYMTVMEQTFKQELDQAAYEASFGDSFEDTFAFTDFTYADSCYTAAAITVDGETFTDVKIKFVEGKVVTISYTLVDTDLNTGIHSTAATECVFEYGTVPAITLPTVTMPME